MTKEYLMETKSGRSVLIKKSWVKIGRENTDIFKGVNQKRVLAEMDQIGLDWKLYKFYMRRYKLFRLFDKGIVLD